MLCHTAATLSCVHVNVITCMTIYAYHVCVFRCGVHGTSFVFGRFLFLFNHFVFLLFYSVIQAGLMGSGTAQH